MKTYYNTLFYVNNPNTHHLISSVVFIWQVHVKYLPAVFMLDKVLQRF
jgi:hypothetical protein